MMLSFNNGCLAAEAAIMQNFKKKSKKYLLPCSIMILEPVTLRRD
jgi:hypothetical protein